MTCEFFMLTSFSQMAAGSGLPPGSQQEPRGSFFDMQGQNAKTWDELTAKQKAWIDYYKSGINAVESARRAGYKDANKAGYENSVKLRSFIADRDTVLERPRIADMEEINTFWSDIIRSDDPEISLKDKLKASELRAKAAGGFLERVELSGHEPVKIIVDIPNGEAE